MKDLDVDGNGKLSLAELDSSDGKGEDDEADSIKHFFRKADANSDGHLDLAELTSFLETTDAQAWDDQDQEAHMVGEDNEGVEDTAEDTAKYDDGDANGDSEDDH